MKFRNSIKNRRKRKNRNSYVHDSLLSWFGIFTSITSGGLRLVLWNHIVKYAISVCYCFHLRNESK